MRFHKLEESFGSGEALQGFLKQDDIAKASVDFVGMLRNSQKFYCGDMRAFPNMKDYAQFPRLPYDTVTFEYLSADGYTFFCLAQEREHAAILDLLFFVRDGGACNFYAAGALTKEGAQVKATFGDAEKGMSEETIRRCREMFSRHVSSLGDFLAVLNCVNVKAQKTEAPAALNKKRAKAGKVPLYEYWTLVLRPSAAERNALGGTHESPRVHLRRGHIKHRQTGDFWWQPCAVGNRKRGIVMKDYRGDRLAPAVA